MNSKTMECATCEERAQVDDRVAKQVVNKYGVWVCSEDCGRDYIYNEFRYMIENNWGVAQ